MAKRKTAEATPASPEAKSLGPRSPKAVRRDGEHKAVPVTVLSGFLGAGKTTLLKHILKNKQGMRCAVIVNDMAELNIDAALVQKSDMLQTEEKLVQLENGCICCTLRDDLLKGVRELAESGKYDYIVVEGTGIAEPMQVAETFSFPVPDASAPSSSSAHSPSKASTAAASDHVFRLQDVARLDCCVTVVDANAFLQNLDSVESVAERYGAGQVAAEDDRNIADLLVDQVEFADVVILNKKDTVSAKQLQKVTAMIKRLNPRAEVIPTVHSQVDLAKILNTNKFDLSRASQHRGWLDSLENPHTPETVEYGISSSVYRAKKPFHPARLYKFLTDNFELTVVHPDDGQQEEDEDEDGSEEESSEEEGSDSEGEESEGEEEEGHAAAASGSGASSSSSGAFGRMYRSKGFVWIASRHDVCVEWGHAGRLVTLSPSGPWASDMHHHHEHAEGEACSHEAGEDARQQQLVLIGSDMKHKRLHELLDACLLTEEELAAYQKNPKTYDQKALGEDPFELAKWPGGAEWKQ